MLEYAERVRRTHYGPLYLTCCIYESDAEEPFRERTFDYNAKEGRDWYTRTFVWAMINNHTIETFPASAIDITNMKR